MQELLDGLLPRLFPGLLFQCVPHDGKTDLERSIPHKLKGWREPGVRFAVVRDNDSGDCRARKKALRELCRAAQRDDTLIRFVCQALEAWYLDEPDALADAFSDEALRNIQRQARFRDADSVQHPDKEIERRVPEFQKVSGARCMAQHLSRERNTSPSLQVFVAGIEAGAADLAMGNDGGQRIVQARPGCLGAVAG